MTRLKSTIDAVAERLRAREIGRLYYFHTDHFEPWQSLGGLSPLCAETVARVETFAETTARIDYARRLTLFYKPYLNLR